VSRRRGWGEGSIQEYETTAGRRFSIVYPIKDRQTGARRQKRQRGYTSRTEAAKALRMALEAERSGTRRDRVTVTFQDYALGEWLPAKRRRESTVAGDRQVLGCYVFPVIGAMPLDKITARDLDRVYARLRSWSSTARGRAGQPLAESTQAMAHTLVSSVFRHAVRRGLLLHNPAHAVDDPPRVRRTQMRFWTPEDAGRFLDATDTERLHAAWLLLIVGGLRRGELLGLTWDAVDLDRGQLSILRTYIAVHGRPAWSEPKTDESARRVLLDPPAVAVLRAHRAAQLAERLRMGEGWSDVMAEHGGLVFTEPDGRPLSPEQFSAGFRKLVRGLGLPAIRVHDLRHTNATLLRLGGADTVTISRHLGHASLAITDRYVHQLNEQTRSAVTGAGDLLRSHRAQVGG